MNAWERLNETLSPDRKEFYSSLNLENTTDVVHKHSKRVQKDLKKNIGDYHDLYVQSDRLLLTDIFESFRNECIKVCKLNPPHFFSAPRLPWQACLKKMEIKLEL